MSDLYDECPDDLYFEDMNKPLKLKKQIIIAKGTLVLIGNFYHIADTTILSDKLIPLEDKKVKLILEYEE